MTTMTVTATPSSGASGGLLRVRVHLHATESGGNTLTAVPGASTFSITPNLSNSLVLWSICDRFSSSSMTQASGNTLSDNVSETDGQRLGSGYINAATTASSPVTGGVTNVDGTSAYLIAAYELPSSDGTQPTIDSSSPVAVSESSGHAALTTASFDPPAGSVVSVCVSGGSFPTWAITDSLGTLTWTKKVDGGSGCQVWTTTIPSTSDTGTGSIAMKKMGISASGIGCAVPISFKTFTTAAIPSTNPVSVPAPAGVQLNDLLLLYVDDATSTVTFTLSGSSGWTTVGPTTGQNIVGVLFYKYADSTDVSLSASGGSYSLTPSSAHSTTGVIICAHAYVLDPVPANAGQYLSSTGTSIPGSSVTTTQTHDQLLTITAVRVASGTPPVITIAAGSTLISQVNSSASSAANVGVIVARETLSSSGATGSRTPTAATSANGGTLILALGSNKITGTAAVHMKKMGLASSGTATKSTLRNNVDGVTSGTTITTGNSGGSSGDAFDLVSIGSGATVAADNTYPGLSGQAIKFATGATSASAYVQWQGSLKVGSKYYFWANCYFTANPAASIRIVSIVQGSNLCASVNLLTDGTIKINNTSGTQMVKTTASIPLNQEFRIEGYVLGDGSVGQAEIKLFSTPKDVTPAETQTSTATYNTYGVPSLIRFGIGAAASNVVAYYMDDLGVSVAGYPGKAAVHLHKMAISATVVETEFGTAAVHLHKMGLSGSGTETDKGTGSVHFHKMGLSGSGLATGVANGLIALHKMALSGSGTESDKGTGSIRIHKMGLSGSGRDYIPGSGSVHMHKMGLSGSAVETEFGTGSVSLHKMSLSGSGTETFTGSGSVHMHKMGLSGSGTESETVAGSGSVSLHRMGLSGSGTETDKGTGSVHLHKMGLSGSGDVAGSAGSIALHKMGLSGAGRGTTSGPAHISMHKMQLHGVGRDTGIAIVHMHKMQLHATNIHGRASSMFIFTAV